MKVQEPGGSRARRRSLATDVFKRSLICSNSRKNNDNASDITTLSCLAQLPLFSTVNQANFSLNKLNKLVNKIVMSFMPLWPNLQPRSTDPLWFNADKPCDDEEEVEKLENLHQAWKDRTRAAGNDQIPIGKQASDFRGSEEEEEEEEEEEGEGEEEEESDTHEDEEEEFDEIDMEVSYTHQQQRSSPTETVTDPVSIRMVTTHSPRYS